MPAEKKLVEFNLVEAPIIKIKDSASEMAVYPVTDPEELKEIHEIQQKIETGEIKLKPLSELLIKVNEKLKKAGKPPLASF